MKNEELFFRKKLKKDKRSKMTAKAEKNEAIIK